MGLGSRLALLCPRPLLPSLCCFFTLVLMYAIFLYFIHMYKQSVIFYLEDGGTKQALFFFSFFFLKPELSIKCESAPVCFGGHAYSPRGYSELIQIQLNWLVPAPEKRTVIRTNISLLQVVPPTTHFPGRGHPGEPR